jgi:hypothetical protein
MVRNYLLWKMGLMETTLWNPVRFTVRRLWQWSRNSWKDVEVSRRLAYRGVHNWKAAGLISELPR